MTLTVQEQIEINRRKHAEKEADKKTLFIKKREDLRTQLLTHKVLTDDTKLIFEAEFDGYGDSGSVNANTGNEDVDTFLIQAVDQFVEFDWYNNDGGGGDITWDVVNDKIIINGYINVTSTESILDEEEF